MAAERHRARTKLRTISVSIIVAIVAAVAIAGLVRSAPVANAEQQSAVDTTHYASPVGGWRIEVHVDDGRTIINNIYFTPTGHAFIEDPAGAGTWKTTGPNRFTFKIAEPTFDPATGRVNGWDDIERSAVLTSNTTFTSSGQTTIRDLNDRPVLVVGSNDRGTRL